ncbi:uncharacterized protein LOC124149222 [Haliotis rufescens]|uniref:uncharacterized protein LOC124149222 n=1 Tax=Haliotis rufescens TaxID=6454 RepID=UPI001EB090F6|nr:uncharacterized protein LOC124149222 [Haliotis rufescens]
MNYFPVQIVFLTFLGGGYSHPTTTCPSASQMASCDGSHNYHANFEAAVDPKSWVTADMDRVCLDTSKESFLNFFTCKISAERQCIGSKNQDLVLSINVIPTVYQFVCQEHQRGSVIGTCVTTNKAAIETCYNTAISTITSATADVKCDMMDELERCYMSNLDGCSATTKNVVDIILHKMRPARCGCDVIKASISFIVMAAGAAIFLTRRSSIST